MNKKVMVGMSGGVDSSVSVHLLQEQGYQVEGVSLVLFDPQSRKGMVKAPCCSIEAVADAVRTAKALGVKHTVVDMRGEFHEKVIKPFIEAYSKGVTPNPCILCNRHIKFPSLLKEADSKGFDYIATGHYARVVKGETGARMLRGLDPKKDQSYVLYALQRDLLDRIILPLGEKTKNEVREIARALKMSAANRPESQEICFIEERNYAAYMGDLAQSSTGPIIDIETGNILGTHAGIHLYTLGQRKRLPATGKPLYVVKIDTSSNSIYVGPREMALMREFTVEDPNWLITPESSNFRATVKVRSTMKDEPAVIRKRDDGTISVEFDEPQWAPAPGQSAVFYDGDVVLGGGVIAG